MREKITEMGDELTKKNNESLVVVRWVEKKMKKKDGPDGRKKRGKGNESRPALSRCYRNIISQHRPR